MMEKRNVVSEGRTPAVEFKDINSDWDKVAAAKFDFPSPNTDKPKAGKAGKADKAGKVP